MQDLRGQQVQDPRVFAIQDPTGASEYYEGPSSANPANRALVRESDMMILGSKAGLNDRKAEKAYKAYMQDPEGWAARVGADSPDMLDWTAAQKKRYQELLGVASKKSGSDSNQFANTLGALAVGVALPMALPLIAPAAGAAAGAVTLGRMGKAVGMGLRGAGAAARGVGTGTQRAGQAVNTAGKKVTEKATARRVKEKAKAEAKKAAAELDARAKVKAEMIRSGATDVDMGDEVEEALIRKMMKEMEDAANG